MAGSRKVKKMKIAFIHPSNPFEDNTGATYSANKIVEGLKEEHDLTVYCVSPVKETKDLDYSIQNLLEHESPYRSSTAQLNREIVERKEELAEYDVIYSYPMNTIRGLGKISSETKTIITLNAYGAICPTNTLMYREKHEKLGSLKCIECILSEQAANIGGGGLGYLKKAPTDILRKMLKLRRIRKTRKYKGEIDKFVALTDHVKQRYTGAGFPEEKIEVIPPILDEKFLVEHKSEFKEPYRLLYVGYLKNQKGVDRLVPILEELNHKSEREFHLTVVGDGPFRNKIEKQIAKSPEKDKIDFKGLVPNEELPTIYAEHDLFVYPGRWEEPFGRIFIESLSAGTPVISTSERIAETLNSIIISDISEIPETLNEVLEKQRLKALSETARKEAENYRKSEKNSKMEDVIQGCKK
jgi:glycosyltransferase involved in cell wall biosynthesis